MTAYVISMMSIHDPKTYRKYTDRTPPIVKRHGGKFLTRGGDVTTLEGESYQDRMVILEFPSKQSAGLDGRSRVSDCYDLPPCFIRGQDSSARGRS